MKKKELKPEMLDGGILFFPINTKKEEDVYLNHLNWRKKNIEKFNKENTKLIIIV